MWISEMPSQEQVTYPDYLGVNIKAETRDKLFVIQSHRQLKERRRITFSDIVRQAIDEYIERFPIKE